MNEAGRHRRTDRTPEIELSASWLTNPFGGICGSPEESYAPEDDEVEVYSHHLAAKLQPLIDHGLLLKNFKNKRFSTVAPFLHGLQKIESNHGIVPQHRAEVLLHEALVEHSKPDLQALRSTRKNVADSDSRPLKPADETGVPGCSRPILSPSNVVR